MRRLVVIAVLALALIGPAQAGFDTGNAASYDGVAAQFVRLAQAAPTITVPERIDTDQDTVDFTGNVQGVGNVTLTANGIPIAVAADGSFRIRQQVTVGRSKLMLVAEDSAGQIVKQRVFVRRSARVAETGDFGTYHALVIGNNDYEHLPDLEMAVRDAEAVADLLEDKYGFVVERLIDTTRYKIIKAFDQMRATLTDDDNLLIYYAGHGSLDTGSDEGFWLPVDAERDTSANWVSNNDITGKLRAMRAKHVLVVADSCYSGKLTRTVSTKLRTGTDRTEWLRRMATRRSRTALTSGGLEPVLDAGGGNHSVFAKAFLEALETNNDVLDGQTLFDAIKNPIAVNADQTPQYDDIRKAGHDGGDFLFVPVKVVVTVSIAVPETTAATGDALTAQQEMMFWQSIQSSTDPVMFEEYLRKFPDGTFVGIAKRKRDALLEAEQREIQTAVVVPPPEPGIKVDEIDATFVALKTSNVRAKPTAESDRVGRLSRDDAVAVTGKVADKNWYRIEYEGETAYIFGTLVKEVDAGEIAAWESDTYLNFSTSTGTSPRDEADPHDIYQVCVAHMERCEILIADMTPFRGPSMDVGTAFEMGFAKARRMPIFGYSNALGPYNERVPTGPSNGDPRPRDIDGLLIEDFGLQDNLMVAFGCSDSKVHSSLETALEAAAASFGR